jgi:hypothetical protein
MKNQYKNSCKLILFFLVFLSILSCEKDHDFTPYVENIPENKAKLKFIHAAVGPNGDNFRINYFMNNQKVSGFSSTSTLVTGVLYNTQYPIAINYAFVPSGSQDLKISIPATATVPESTVLTNTIVTVQGKNYSNFLIGGSPNYETFQVNDDFSPIENDKTKAYVRFFNFITNSPVAGYDLVISRTVASVTSIMKTFPNVTYKGGSEIFVPLETLPDTDNTVYTVQIRTPGTTTVIGRIPVGTNFIPRPGRVYTIYSVGFLGGIPNSTTNVPVVNFYTNR